MRVLIKFTAKETRVKSCMPYVEVGACLMGILGSSRQICQANLQFNFWFTGKELSRLPQIKDYLEVAFVCSEGKKNRVPLYFFYENHGMTAADDIAQTHKQTFDVIPTMILTKLGPDDNA